MALPGERIVIRPEELADPRVDDALRAAQSFGMATARPDALPEPTTRLLFRPWFLVMLAGALGALLAWILIEPFFDDLLVFRANVTNMSSVAIEGSAFYTLELSGTPAVIDLGAAEILLDGEPSDVGVLREGQVAEVHGEPTEDGSGMVVARLNVLPNDTDTYAPVDVPSYRLRDAALGLAVFPLLASLIGLFVGAADGLVSRAAHRALSCGLIGLGAGLGFGGVAGMLANVVFGVTQSLIERVDDASGSITTTSLLIQVMSRGLAWAIAGAAVGLGQGIAFQSRRLLLNGLLGGAVGGLVGGLLFDPIYFGLASVNPSTGIDAWLSRGIGFTVIGACTGLMIGVVELLARDAWVKLMTGPLAGKEFVFYRDPTRIGSSPKSEVFLFKDAEVEPTHALVHIVGEGWEVEDQGSATGTWVNGRKVKRQRLRPGDQIRIGKTAFVFHSKEG